MSNTHLKCIFTVLSQITVDVNFGMQSIFCGWSIFSFVTMFHIETPNKEKETKDFHDLEAESLVSQESLNSSALSEFLELENIACDSSDITQENVQNLLVFQNVQNSLSSYIDKNDQNAQISETSQNPQIFITFHNTSNSKSPQNYHNSQNPQKSQSPPKSSKIVNRPRNRPKNTSKWLTSLYDVLIKQHYLRRLNIFGYNNEMDNEYILQPKDLDSRLINAQIVFASILLIYNSIMLMIVLYYKLSNSSNNPKIVLPEIQNSSNNRGFPHQHLALIYQDGSVYDFSNISQKFLFKLPSDTNYYGYSNNPLGTLYILKGSLTKKVTKFDGETHRTIQSSVVERFSETYFNKALQVGDLFWVWDQRYQRDVNFYQENIGGCRNTKEDWQDYCQETLIWYTERQLWGKGPKLPTHLIYPWDAAPVNRTAVMIVGIWSTNVRKCVSMVFDFSTKSFVSYPQIDLDKSAAIWSVSITTAIDKQSKR